MKVSKSIKLKLIVLVAFILLMFVQVGPYLLYADEKELSFSYQNLELIAKDDYYGERKLYFSKAMVGENRAYCLDYGIPLPVSSGGTVKLVRQITDARSVALASVLAYGYPNVSYESMGLQSEDEAVLATQLAVWTVAPAAGQAQKTDKKLKMDNLEPYKGYEACLDRIKRAANLLIARADASPYTANPSLNISSKASKLAIDEKDHNVLIAGPYKINGSGMDVNAINVTLSNAPTSAYLCDVNGNKKDSFQNGDDIYVRLAANLGETSFKITVNSSGYYKLCNVYGTGISNDAKQDYVFVKNMPVNLEANLTIDVPELSGGISIFKTDQYNTPIAGVKFLLKDTSGKVLDEKITDANGKIEFSNLKIGKYIIKEEGEVSGYRVMDLPIEVSVIYNKVTPVTVVNEKIEGGLKIVKYDETKEVPLSGVVFQIYDENDNPVGGPLPPTNSKGETVSGKLSVGNYYFREISAPDNIEINNKKQKFEIKDPSKIVVVNVWNYYKKGKLIITKTTEDNKPIKGIVFEILDENKNVIETIKTDANGKAQTSKLKKGTYYYREKPTEDSKLYVVDETEKKFVMDYKDVDVTVVNKYAKGQLKIIKRGDDGRAIEGVIFKIYDENMKVVDTKQTDANGTLFSEKLPLGKYYYQEFYAPPIVAEKDTTLHDFTLTYNDQVIERKVINVLIKLARLEIIKVDELGNRLNGVIFNILDKDKNIVDTITTENDGTAVTKELPLGKYYYQEANELPGVVRDPEEHVFTLSKNAQLLSVHVKNTLKRGSLSIYKVDEDGKYLEGIKFTLLDKDGNEIDKKITDKSGLAKFEDLLPGEYSFKEVDIPSIYVDTKKTTPIKITIEQLNVEVKVVNEFSKGTLKITKSDDLGRRIEGVKFEIYNENKEFVQELVTDEKGVAVSDKLRLGKYYYVEKKAPDNVEPDDSWHDFKLTYNKQVIERRVINVLKRGSLTIHKVDENGNSIKGITFTLWDGKGEFVASENTDKDGLAKFVNLMPGKYMIVESNTPPMYAAITTEIPVEITLDNLDAEKTVVNKFGKGVLHIYKTDELGNKLEGVVFELLDEDKNVIDKITTDENGFASYEGLKIGKYYYREFDAPSGIEKDQSLHDFNITEDGQIVRKDIVNKLERGSLSIFKVDEDGNYLKGVKFTLLNEKGEEIDEDVTGEDGLAKFENLLPGKYNFKEVDAPVNVVKDENLKPIEITVDKLNVDVEVKNNFVKGILRILKTDEAKKPLKGVTFEIYDENKQTVDTIKTNEDGIAESKKLLFGKYYFKEIKADDPNIIVDSKLRDFKIVEDNDVVIAEIVNKTLNGTLLIKKVDSRNKNKVLEGAKFEVYDQDMNVISTITTNKNGEAGVSDLKVGKYYYKEIKAPDGYILESKLVEFNISQKHKDETPTVYNEEKQLPQTGGFLSTNALIVIIVTVVSVAGYVTITIIAKAKNKEDN